MIRKLLNGTANVAGKITRGIADIPSKSKGCAHDLKESFLTGYRKQTEETKTAENETNEPQESMVKE